MNRPDLERRASAAPSAGSGRTLTGYAATFNNPTKIGDFTEIIAPGAFAQSLSARADILALVDHNPEKLLGRTAAGTLDLRQDANGLAYTITLPDTSLGRDILTLAERGDLGGMSFGFAVPKAGDAWEGRTRTLKSVTLFEISVVTAFPAYQGTSIQARAAALPRLSITLAGRYLETLR